MSMGLYDHLWCSLNLTSRRCHWYCSRLHRSQGGHQLRTCWRPPEPLMKYARCRCAHSGVAMLEMHTHAKPLGPLVSVQAFGVLFTCMLRHTAARDVTLARRPSLARPLGTPGRLPSVPRMPLRFCCTFKSWIRLAILGSAVVPLRLLLQQLHFRACNRIDAAPAPAAHGLV